MKQITLFQSGILQRRKSKPIEVKKRPDFVEYWSEIHQDTNWNDVRYDLRHGKKSETQLDFKMVGTGEAKTC